MVWRKNKKHPVFPRIVNQLFEAWIMVFNPNQWSVLAILLFAKNADNENKKYLKIKVILYISHSKQKKKDTFF